MFVFPKEKHTFACNLRIHGQMMIKALVFCRCLGIKYYSMNRFKSLIILVALGSLCSLWAQKENTDSVSVNTDSATVSDKKDKVLGIHPWKTPQHVGKKGTWSLNFEIGLNLFDGDISQPFATIIPTSQMVPTFGVGLEYSITPVWGIAAEYYYAPYYVKDANGPGSYLDGLMQSAEVLATFDLIDAWFPQRKKSVFSWYLLAGGGLAWYNCKLYNPNGITVDGATGHNSRIFGTEASVSEKESGNDIAGVIPIGMAFEFNICRTLAIGVKGLYRIHTKDNLDSWAFAEPIKNGTTNDFMEYMTVNLRWKFPARHRDHLRNWREPEDTRLQDLAKRVDSLEAAKPDSAVPPRVDTVYMVSNPIPVIIPAAPKTEDAIPYIYFDNDKYILLDESLVIIHQVASKMQADTSICVELRGFCDNTASVEYNQTLSQNRSNVTQRELMGVYGISADRMVANGRGKLTNPPTSYRPNRRVEFRFMSKADLEKVRAAVAAEDAKALEQQEKPQNQPVKEEKAPVTEKQTSTTAQSVTFAEPRTYTEFIAKETIQAGRTLTRLAKRYYGEGVFWVYIYEANKSKIKNPDRIPEGLQLQIPVLPKDLIDTANPTCIEYARKLERNIRLNNWP